MYSGCVSPCLVECLVEKLTGSGRQREQLLMIILGRVTSFFLAEEEIGRSKSTKV